MSEPREQFLCERCTTVFTNDYKNIIRRDGRNEEYCDECYDIEIGEEQ